LHPFTAETAHNHSLHNTFTRTGKRFFAPTFAAIFIALCMVFVQQTQASTAAQLVTQINSYGLGGGTGTPLSASASGNTVTVTGNVTNATAELTLNIDANVTVKWQATISNITTGDPR
jgi:predicted secreted Zn-dependent protease